MGVSDVTAVRKLKADNKMPAKINKRPDQGDILIEFIGAIMTAVQWSFCNKLQR